MKHPLLKKITLIATLLVGFGLIIFAIVVYRSVLTPNTNFAKAKADVYIGSEDDYHDVKAMLEPLLKNWDSFEKWANQKQYFRNIKPGRFVIENNMTNYQIMMALRRNIPVKVTFNNQERIQNLAGRVSMMIEADSLEILNAFWDEKFLKENDFNKDNVMTLVLPNTYEFYWNTTGNGFRDKMYKEYIKFWNEERESKAAALNLSPTEVVILASIVHKETVKADERPKVAGVYLNRLKKGMRLEADPTVIYAVKKQENNFDLEIKRVLRNQLLLDSPYNTYQINGLPPGPIFLPDVNAIEAVLNAEKHEYIFFCASTTNFGYHKFAKTLDEHERNATVYRKWLSQQGVFN